MYFMLKMQDFCHCYLHNGKSSMYNYINQVVPLLKEAQEWFWTWSWSGIVYKNYMI